MSPDPLTKQKIDSLGRVLADGPSVRQVIEDAIACHICTQEHLDRCDIVCESAREMLKRFGAPKKVK